MADQDTELTTQIDIGFDVLPSCRAEWERLFQSERAEPSASYDWSAALVRHALADQDRGFLVRLRRRGALVGVVPLVYRVRRRLARPVRTLMPLSELSNTHSDMLLDPGDGQVVGAAVDALARLGVRWDTFEMRRLLEAHPLGLALRSAFHRRGYLLGSRLGLPAYVLDLPDTFEAYLASRSAKFRNHLKRTERKLLGAGRVDVHQLEDPRRFEDAYAALLEVEHRSWKQTHGSSIAAVSAQTGFYEDLGRGASAAGRLHLQWMTLDGRPIAHNLGYLTAGRYHYLKTSYDHALRPLGPSTVLRARLIADLIGRGIRQFDFPGEPYEWEDQWASGLRWRITLSAYPRTAVGHLLSLASRWRQRNDQRALVHLDPRRSAGHDAGEARG